MLYLYLPNRETIINICIDQPAQIYSKIWTDEYIELITKSTKQHQEIHLEFKNAQSTELPQISDEAFKHLGELKPSNSLTLLFFGLKFDQITPNAFTNLGKSFQNLLSLNLRITAEMFTSQIMQVECLMELCKCLPLSLVSLNLNISGHQILHTENFYAIGDKFEKMKNLRELTLTMKNCKFCSDGADFLFSQLCTLELIILNLDLSGLLVENEQIYANLMVFLLTLLNRSSLVDANVNIENWNAELYDQLNSRISQLKQKAKAIYQIEALKQMPNNKVVNIIELLQ